MTDRAMLENPAPHGAGLFFDPKHPASPHLLGLEGMLAEDLRALLDAADAYRRAWAERGTTPTRELAGVEVCNAFFEGSTRTRCSFEIAEQRLGATHVTFTPAGTSVSKGESLRDTLMTIASMGVRVVVIRHASAGAAAFVARNLPVAVVNAGDGAHEHPTQGLLDLLTARDAWGGRFAGRRLAIVGDIAHSRVARSAVHGFTALGARVTLAGPATLMPAGAESLGADVAPTVEDAMRGADALMTLRIQRERMDEALLPSESEYARAWGIDAARVALLAPGAIVMHPGPVNRGVEIASDVMDGPRSVIFDQVANGVAVRCAVLARCARRLELGR